MHDRTAADSPELLRLSLAGVGRGAALERVEPGEIVRDEDERSRVWIRRSGIVEWYENSSAGLEQGFALSARPAGEGPLVLELAVAGARLSLRGDAVMFEIGSRKLRYGELAASDAGGMPLAARFELASAGRLRIAVDDAAARYPVAIDPILTSVEDAQLESNQATAGFGLSVAGAGDTNGDGYADVMWLPARLRIAPIASRGPAKFRRAPARRCARERPTRPSVRRNQGRITPSSATIFAAPAPRSRKRCASNSVFVLCSFFSTDARRPSLRTTLCICWIAGSPRWRPKQFSSARSTPAWLPPCTCAS